MIHKCNKVLLSLHLWVERERNPTNAIRAFGVDLDMTA